ncbi:MAG TPA: SGNH/GDSL hydrolase family protein [Streptosporangiaceae bacterium]|jgi:lysophospholipase L1-like esterase
MEAAGMMAEIGSFAALGDSFTEGLADRGPDDTYRGWADRFAEILAVGNPRLRYANLAVRGKLLGEVVAEQLPPALAMAPDLVSIAAGGNDLLRPGADPDVLAAEFEGAVAQLRAGGAQVMVFTGFDPRTFPVIRWIRGKVAVYNMHLRGIAERYGCILVDLWSMPVLCDPRVWSADRLHLTSEGHRRVTLRACEALALTAEDWRGPLPESPAPAAAGVPAAPGVAAARGQVVRSQAAWLAARRVDARWMRVYALPWARRRIRGASSGDGVLAKRPELLPLDDLTRSAP